MCVSVVCMWYVVCGVCDMLCGYVSVCVSGVCGMVCKCSM